MYFGLFTIFQESIPFPPPRYPLPSMESSVCDIMINGHGVKKLPLQQIEDSK